MRDYLKEQELKSLVAGRSPNKYVFPGRTALRPYSYQSFLTNVWQPMMKLSGLRYRTVHQLRHTYATLLFAAGKDLYYVSRQLGHANILITAKVYVHYLPGSDRQAVNALVAQTRPDPSR